MAESIEDLVVRAKPEGISETSDGFQTMQSDLADAEGQMGETTSQFEDLQSRWQGALGAIVAGIAVGVGGLMNTVPVLGELMGSVASVASALGYQLDQVIRPAINPLTNLFYDLSGAIYEADGALGDIIGVITGVAAIVGSAVTAYLGWVAATQGIVAAAGTLAGGLSTVAGIIGSVVSAIAGLISLPALVIAAIVGLTAALIFNIGGLRDKVGEFIGQIIGFFSNLASKAGEHLKNLWTKAKEWLGNLGTNGVEYAKSLYNGIVDWLSSLPGKAVEFGKAVYDGFLGALEGIGSGLANAFITGLNAVIKLINTAIEKIPGGVANKLGLGKLDTVSAGDLGLDLNTGSGNNGGNNNGFSARRQGNPNVYLDGKDVTDNTGRYRRNATSRRGRDG